jgi:hypothetical protein
VTFIDKLYCCSKASHSSAENCYFHEILKGSVALSNLFIDTCFALLEKINNLCFSEHCFHDCISRAYIQSRTEDIEIFPIWKNMTPKKRAAWAVSAE